MYIKEIINFKDTKRFKWSGIFTVSIKGNNRKFVYRKVKCKSIN